MSAAEQFVGNSGRTFAYFPERLIGAGRFGKVFEGRDDGDLPVAVKIVPIDASTSTRFVAEGALTEREVATMRKLASVQSEHVVPLLDFSWESQIGDAEEALVLIMPLADSSLEARLAQGPLPESEARNLLFALARGMVAIHSKGIIHRDIKPANVLLLNGQWALTDFGIARDTEMDTSTLTWEGTGTRAYWAPELFQGEIASLSTDLYAAGITTLEALTGVAVFSGRDLKRLHREGIPDIPRLEDRVLARLIATVLAKYPASRPPDAREVVEGLEGLNSLGEDQRSLQDLLAFQSLATLRHDAERGLVQTQNEIRDDAFRALERVWNDLVRRAAVVAPKLRTHIQSEEPYFERFLIIGPVRMRISAQLPHDKEAGLVLGTLDFRTDEEGSVPQLLASVYSELAMNGSVVWWLGRYSANYLARDRLAPALSTLSNSGVEIGVLERFLSETRQGLAAKILVEERHPLTGARILQLLVDAARQHHDVK